MTAAELREMDGTELDEALADAKEELFNLRFQLATNQLDNTAKLKQLRRRIAQIKTLLNERAQKPAAKQA